MLQKVKDITETIINILSSIFLGLVCGGFYISITYILLIAKFQKNIDFPMFIRVIFFVIFNVVLVITTMIEYKQRKRESI
jgi:ABC-type multidrug transport system permease subunit